MPKTWQEVLVDRARVQGWLDGIGAARVCRDVGMSGVPEGTLKSYQNSLSELEAIMPCSVCGGSGLWPCGLVEATSQVLQGPCCACLGTGIKDQDSTTERGTTNAAEVAKANTMTYTRVKPTYPHCDGCDHDLLRSELDLVRVRLQLVERNAALSWKIEADASAQQAQEALGEAEKVHAELDLAKYQIRCTRMERDTARAEAERLARDLAARTARVQKLQEILVKYAPRTEYGDLTEDGRVMIAAAEEMTP